MIISHEDLSRLNDTQFEKLIKTLLLSVIGSGVTPFSQGKDGAREATYKGKTNYPSKTDNWTGSWIFQVKYSNITFGIDKARNQIKYSINNELKKLEEYNYFESNKCNNYIFITNVPFSGEADKGLHDYIQIKRKNYKVKNFDYWDGEKVIGFLNTFSNVRETFFPNPGIEILDTFFFTEINKTFVKPILYESLKNEILSNKILNIVGQPHVGKSFLALYLAQDIFNLKGLNEIVLVPIIDNISVIPKMIDCIIIFDDLYGDLNYDSIGKQTKIINTLSKNNYIIITSRDYIFDEAEQNKELINGQNFIINQEGAYTDVELEKILSNHIDVNFIISSENMKAHKFIIKNTSLIIRELRFPHNIQLFTTIIDETVINKTTLDDKIAKAKVIENIIITWVSQQEEVYRNILLSLAIGRIQEKEILYKICKTQWNYDPVIIDRCLEENLRLIYYDISIIRFKHPSFKSSIVNFFLKNHKEIITNLILNLILQFNSSDKKKINRAVAYQIIEDLEIEMLIKIIKEQDISRNFLEIIWLNLFRKDRNQALNLLFSLADSTEKGRKHFICLVSSKAFMKDKEILLHIDYFMKNRDINPLIDRLIEQFSHKVRLKIRPIINTLNYKIPKDFTLLMKLLGSIGSKYPDLVLAEILSFAYESSPTNRRQVYSAMNMLDRSIKNKIEKAYIEILTRETHSVNIKKINNTLKKLRKI